MSQGHEASAHSIIASAAGKRGQGGLDLWVLRTWLKLSVAQLVLHATSRILIVKLVTIIGVVQVVVAHALISPTQEKIVLTRWKELCYMFVAVVGKRGHGSLANRCQPHTGISPI